MERTKWVFLFIIIYFWSATIGSYFAMTWTRAHGDLLGMYVAIIAYFLFLLIAIYFTLEFVWELIPHKPPPASPKPKI